LKSSYILRKLKITARALNRKTAWESMGKAEKAFRILAIRRNSKWPLGRQKKRGYHIMLRLVNKLSVGIGGE
jgi:hypothetical protein